ncbi:Pectinesterase inhibitor domain [Arabidopsis suecica]|nr:Pectinesterase inhibitor domain [Arabidopsis suecica]
MSNAMPISDVHNFCKETFEVEFCMKYIGSDQRLLAARDFSDMLLIPISETQIQVTNAITQINNIRQRFNDTLGKNRIALCEEKYESAGTSFHKAWEVGQKKSNSSTDHMEITRNTQAGFDAVCECEDEWAKHGPKQESPLTFYYHNVLKLCQITRLIISKL